jgi:hypothetical protein
VTAVKYRNRFSLSRSGTDLDTHKSTPSELKVLRLSFLRKWKGCVVCDWDCGMLGADCLSVNHPLSFSTLEKDKMEALISYRSS